MPLAIARAFTTARREGRALADFPGMLPADLEHAYAVQDHAIALWQGSIAGWKVGYIAEAMRDSAGDERLLGPIFRSHLWNDTGAITEISVFSGAGGFAAVEAEFGLEVLEDAPAGQFHWTLEQAQALPARLYIGVEVASSPLATINVLGPRAVISDFGNNNGLVLGAEVVDWTARAEDELRVETCIDGHSVGSGGAARLRAAYAFALARSARRGRPLRRGDLIATGNATGIHDIAIGQVACLRFAGDDDITCRAVAAG
ncbi:MAG: 2-keto-4-pentenoate hydratase [Stenotrophomonas maltophilia]|uniref:2-keto-4-pentenoate hydratase n=1 Tax=Stenotrophomonas maltophilia TaxID=40324 RepID=A0A7V8JK38_STEMA|nr:MAG: 2-keto-4-pentenoate hydratase [Stenotrophomonas maltophilia]